MSERTQGAQANKTGHILESTVENAFRQHGFGKLSHREFRMLELLGDDGAGGDYLVKNYPYTSIYGHEGKTEFLAVSARRNLRVRIECKWQQCSGSVDEKFPYLMENCRIMPEDRIIILVDGGGYKPGALAWLKKAAEACTEKDIKVLDIAGFLKWTNTEL